MAKISPIAYVNDDNAKAACALWGAEPASLRPLGHSGASVYYASVSGAGVVIKFYNSSYRSLNQVEAEANFVRYLASKDIGISIPVKSREKRDTEVVSVNGLRFIGIAFRFVEGQLVLPSSKEWSNRFLVEWGQYLGKLHDASEGFIPDEDFDRWQWLQEVWIAKADQLLPVDDSLARDEFNCVMECLQSFERTNNNFGVVHGDFAPQNFMYSPSLGIRAFDFGNCCFNWFLADVVVSLTSIRRSANPDRDKDTFLSGYYDVRESHIVDWKHIQVLLRFRVLYVYLSRLFKFGPNPTIQEKNTLSEMRDRVIEGRGW